MNLIPKLTAKQRSELEGTVEFSRKVLARQEATAKRLAKFREIETATLQKIEKLNVAADEGDLAASEKLYGRQDQLMRLRLSIARVEKELVEQLAEFNRVGNIARQEIRSAHASVLGSLVDHIAGLLAPFCEYSHAAKALAQETFAFGQLSVFARKTNPRPPFETSAEAIAALESYTKSAEELLAGRPIIEIADSGDRRGIVFPAFCN